MEGTVAEPMLAVVRLVWGVVILWGYSGGKYFTVRLFAKIVWKTSIAASCESHILVGTSLSAADKKCIAWVILYSAVTWVCVRCTYKYSAVSVIINYLVFPSIDWMQRY